MNVIEVDVSELGLFADKLEQAGKSLHKELEKFLEGLGEEFLRIITDEIVSNGITVSRALLKSFQRGKENNVWEIQDGGLTLEIGSDVEYAKWVNDGHFQEKRFVPGVWEGKKFIYQKGAKTGMMFTARWVEGRHYFDHGLNILEKMIPGFIDKKVQDWLDTYL